MSKNKKKRFIKKTKNNTLNQFLLPIFFLILFSVIIFFLRSDKNPLEPLTCISGDPSGMSLIAVEDAVARCYPEFTLSVTSCKNEIRSSDAKSELAQLCVLWLPDPTDTIRSRADINGEYADCLQTRTSPSFCNARREATISEELAKCTTHANLLEKFPEECNSLTTPS